MTMFNALFGTVFLILVAASAAVTGSMIVLALFDLAFGKKSTPPVVTDRESDQLEPPSKPRVGVAESKPKPEPLAAYRRGYLAKRSADLQPGCGPQTQRVRFWDAMSHSVAGANETPVPMQIGYARSSTVDQEAGFQAQIKSLKAAGCEKVFSEQVSSLAQREQLEAALELAREGDCLTVTKIDRLAKSVSHLVAIVERLEAKGVALRVLDQAIDTSNFTGRMFKMLGDIAQFERELMLERQREGVAKAKAEGKYKGRVPTARAKASEVLRLRSEGVGPTEIGKRLSVSRTSVYRILNKARITATRSPELGSKRLHSSLGVFPR